MKTLRAESRGDEITFTIVDDAGAEHVMSFVGVPEPGETKAEWRRRHRREALLLVRDRAAEPTVRRISDLEGDVALSGL